MFIGICITSFMWTSEFFLSVYSQRGGGGGGGGGGGREKADYLFSDRWPSIRAVHNSSKILCCADCR